MYMGHSVSYSNCFLAKSMATQEMEYVNFMLLIPCIVYIQYINQQMHSVKYKP